MFANIEKINKIKNKYPAGTRVQLVSMDDQYSRLKAGDKGTVKFVDDIGTIHVRWDCGSSLGLIHGVDKFRKII